MKESEGIEIQYDAVGYQGSKHSKWVLKTRQIEKKTKISGNLTKSKKSK